MFPDAHLFVGIDPCGVRKSFTYAVLDKSGRLTALGAGKMEAVLGFLDGLRSALLAINAPPRPSLGLAYQENERQKVLSLRGSGRNLDMRLAEHQLRQRGIKVPMTPAHIELCSSWTQAGFEFYRRIEKLGFHPYTIETFDHAWIETHPQATFCALLEQTPFPRSTLEGRLQRQLVLYEQGLNIRDPMDFFEEITRHKLMKGFLPLDQVFTSEQLDALAAACSAWLLARHPERICRVGDVQEGQILVPVVELKSKY